MPLLARRLVSIEFKIQNQDHPKSTDQFSGKKKNVFRAVKKLQSFLFVY